MNKIIWGILLCLTTNAFADLEHRNGQGATPSVNKLTMARGCFAEIESQGCDHPRNGQEAFNNCLEVHKDELTPGCKTFFTRLYGKRK